MDIPDMSLTEINDALLVVRILSLVRSIYSLAYAGLVNLDHTSLTNNYPWYPQRHVGGILEYINEK